MKLLILTCAVIFCATLVLLVLAFIRETKRPQPKFGWFKGDPRLRSSGRLTDEYLKGEG